MTTTATTVRQRRHLIGTVVSAKKTPFTIVVEVGSRLKHSLFGKYVSKRKRYLVQDRKQEAQIGDKVEIQEVRPLSARKRFSLTRVVTKTDLPADERTGT